MNSEAPHIIEKLTVQMQTNSKKLAYRLKDEKDAFFMEELLELLASVFDEYMSKQEQLIRLDKINIKVIASSRDFEFDVKRQVLEQLAAVLPKYILEEANSKLRQEVPESNSVAVALLHFLKTGSFPWWFNAPKDNKAMDALIYKCIEIPAFIDGFANGLNDTTFKARCTAQLTDGFLVVIFNKILKAKYGQKDLLSKSIDKSLKLASNKVVRVALWDFVSNICTAQSIEQIGQSWERLVVSLLQLKKLVKPVQIQLDMLLLRVVGLSTIEQQKLSLASVYLDNQKNKQKNEANLKDQHSGQIDDTNISTDSVLENEDDSNKSARSNTLEKENKQEAKQSHKTDRTTKDELSSSESNEPNTSQKSQLQLANKEAKKAQEINKKQAPKQQDHEKLSKKSSKKDSQVAATGDPSNQAQQNESNPVEPLDKEYLSLKNSKTPLELSELEKIDAHKYHSELERIQPKVTPDLVSREDHFYAGHCGLVLVHPFLASFLKNCDLLDKNKHLKDPVLTAHLLHYLASGKTAAYEHQLRFERFLCHIPYGLPIERHIEIPQKLLKKANELLLAVLGHLPQLKSSAPTLLQNEFLSREGKVTLEGENPRILIERKTQDILLDSKPWSTSIVKLPWLPNLLFVDW